MHTVNIDYENKYEKGGCLFLSKCGFISNIFFPSHIGPVGLIKNRASRDFKRNCFTEAQPVKTLRNNGSVKHGWACIKIIVPNLG